MVDFFFQTDKKVMTIFFSWDFVRISQTDKTPAVWSAKMCQFIQLCEEKLDLLQIEKLK